LDTTKLLALTFYTMKKLFFLSLLFCPFLLSGQPFINKQPLRMPQKFVKPKFETSTDQSISAQLSNQYWSVWIDRKGVTTSNGKVPKFMDRFLVVEQKSDQVHIVLDNGAFSNSVNMFMEEPEDYGWVNKSNCVLSPFALYSSESNFRIKVMTITTPEMMQKDMERIKEGAKKLAFFDTPTDIKPNDKETPLFEFFFILKREGSRFLLSKKEDLTRGNAIDYVNGWVDIPSVQIWDQRQALEPNWDKDAANERIKKNVKSSIFSDSASAKLFASRKNINEPFWSDDRYAVRYSPYWKRLPVLKQRGNLVETAVVSDLVQESGDSLKFVKNDQMMDIDRLLNEQIARSRFINLVFVIDGTQSMGPYLLSVRNAVIQSATAIQNSANTFKYGAVIYRDYEKSDYDNDCYMVQKLTDFNQFSRFMTTVDPNEPKCVDQSTSEGMYLGLKKVENVLRGSEKQTNIVIVIGDSGDREGEGRIKESDVIPLLTKFNCGILAMQVHHKQDVSYEDFIFQLRDLGIKNAVEISNINKKEYGELNLTSLSTTPRWKQDKAGNRTLYLLQNGPVNGGLQYVVQGQSFNPDLFTTEVKKIITSTNTKNDSLINDLRKLLTVVPEDKSKESGLTQEAIQLLRKAGFSSEQINILRQRNYQFMLRGHTPIKLDSLKNDVYNYIIFLDQRELEDMRITLDRLYDPGQVVSKRRERLQTAWKEILRANYGVTTEEIADKSLAELMGLITGLPSLNPLLKKFRVTDLTDIAKVSDSEFDAIVNNILKKRDDLNRLMGNKEFFFLSNDRPWYWIPQSYLP
jgi:hypothetical protein